MMTATPTEERTAITLRSRPIPHSGGICCGACFDAIEHDGKIWRHVRTNLPAAWNDSQCAPLCDWPGCEADADATRSLGGEEWTGSGFRYRARHFLCAAHWLEYTRTHGVIERT